MMRQIRLVMVTVAVLLGIALVGGGPFTAAQNPGRADHPAVGSWQVESDPGDAEYTPGLVIMAADGAALFVSGQQTTGVGVWQAMGDTTAVATFVVTTNGPAYILIRARIELASDGQSFTGTYTMEAIFDPSGGGTSGEVGPGTLAGTRISAAAPGTPIMSFAEFFPQPEGTPSATPAP